MTPTGLRLYKQEKLCSLTAIEQLFSSSAKAAGENNSIMAYPWRAVWRIASRPDHSDCPRFLISVPKKRLRHAVDRVLMRRRMREAYRLNRIPDLADVPLEIAFIYVADRPTPHTLSHKAVKKILHRISQAISTSTPQPEAE